MPTPLSDRIWKRYTRPGLTQRGIGFADVLRRAQSPTLASPDFAAGIQRRWEAADSAPDANPLPIVASRPAPIAEAAELPSPTVIQRAPDEAPPAPSPAVTAAASPPESRPVVQPTVIQRRPDALPLSTPESITPKHDSAPITDQSQSATPAPPDRPVLPVVRPHAIQRAPDALPVASPRPTAISSTGERSTNENAVSPQPLPLVQPTSIPRGPDAPTAISPAVMLQPSQPKGDLAAPDQKAETLLSERPVVQPHAIQRTPDPSSSPDRPLAWREGSAQDAPRLPAAPIQSRLEAASAPLMSEQIVISPAPIPASARAPALVYRSVEKSAEARLSVSSAVIPPAVMRAPSSPAETLRVSPASLTPYPLNGNGAAAIQRVESATPPAPAEAPSTDDLVEKVLQKFMRQLAVENERRGKW